jgi:hypothetical protein
MASSKCIRIALACVVGATLGGRVWAQTASDTHTHPHKDKDAAASSKTNATLKAELVDPAKKAKGKEATVKVDVSGAEIVDPATVNEKAKAGQGHLHYTVDDGPTIATTAKKLSFHGLKSGKHTIKVALAGNDHSPLGPEQTLDVEIP